MASTRRLKLVTLVVSWKTLLATLRAVEAKASSSEEALAAAPLPPREACTSWNDMLGWHGRLKVHKTAEGRERL
jgi:hypothetical protein